MIFKTKPYAHQQTGFDLSKDREYFGLLMETGTGKTKVGIDTATYLYGKGRINAVFVIAPNGVHFNWALNEIPTHLPDAVKHRAAVWTAAKTKKQEKQIARLYEPGNFLRLFFMNIDAFTTQRGVAEAKNFLRTFDVLLILDESHRIKNPKAKWTKALLDLSPLAKYRRIMTGTPVTESPLNAFSQMLFLDPSILKSGSFHAFKAEYCQLLPQGHGLVRHIRERMKGGGRFNIQIVEKDAAGKPIYRNLDRLRKLMSPHTYRVLKKDCLSLPEKVYTKIYCGLEGKQLRDYRELRTQLRIELQDGSLHPVTKLTRLSRTQQIVGGFGPDDTGTNFTTPYYADPLDNPRIQQVLDVLEGNEGAQVIIWARYIQEILAICAAIKAHLPELSVRPLYGEVKKNDRHDLVTAFQAGEVDVVVAQQRTGGTGTTMTAASIVIYYSNEFSLSTRIQSEDRAHRIGQVNRVTYIDIVALETDDQKIIDALVAKKEVADVITGDTPLPWLQ